MLGVIIVKVPPSRAPHSKCTYAELIVVLAPILIRTHRSIVSSNWTMLSRSSLLAAASIILCVSSLQVQLRPRTILVVITFAPHFTYHRCLKSAAHFLAWEHLR